MEINHQDLKPSKERCPPSRYGRSWRNRGKDHSTLCQKYSVWKVRPLSAVIRDETFLNEKIRELDSNVTSSFSKLANVTGWIGHAIFDEAAP